jgi:hypothetical protein
MSNKWKFFWVISFVSVIFFQACWNSWEEIFINTADEKKMGREFDSLVRDGSKDVLDPAKNESLWIPQTSADIALYNYYVDRGKEIVKEILPKDMDGLMTREKLCRNNPDDRTEKSACNKDNFFEFKIIKSSQINAFAVPGGYVYFYTEILKENNKNKDGKNVKIGFQSESELSSVLSHEIGHIVLHHSRDRMIKAVGASTLISIFLGDGMAGLIGTLGANFWLMGNSQDNEFEADSMGFYYTNKIGVSSEGLGDFFARGLKSYNPSTGECSERQESSVLDVFSTHPPSCERVNKNTKRIKNSGQNFPKDIHFGKNGESFKELVNAAGI